MSFKPNDYNQILLISELNGLISHLLKRSVQSDSMLRSAIAQRMLEEIFDHADLFIAGFFVGLLCRSLYLLSPAAVLFE